MADTKTLGTYLASAALIAGAIFVSKPAKELPQLDCATVIECADAKTIEAHQEGIRKDSVINGDLQSVVIGTIDVPETIERPQVAITLDSAFRAGDIYRVTIYRNDSLMFENKTTISEATYPKNGNVLKAYNYTQWVESKAK